MTICCYDFYKFLSFFIFTIIFFLIKTCPLPVIGVDLGLNFSHPDDNMLAKNLEKKRLSKIFFIQIAMSR